MKLLSCVSTLLIAGLLATPCFSAEKLMKNEPKTIGGLACGDTPFKAFTPEQYIGKHITFGCAKIYQKNDLTYDFNGGGQLYEIMGSCDAKSIKAFTKKHGEPTSLQKSGNDRYEGKLYTWNGKDVKAVFYATTSNLPGGNSDNCMANYYCKKIQESVCDTRELSIQAERVDQFVKSIGANADFMESEKPDKKAQLIETLNTNAQRLGLPKSEEIDFYQRKISVNTACMEFKQADSRLIKKLLYDTVGDISKDIHNPTFTGNSSLIEYMDYSKSAWQAKNTGVRVCFTGFEN